LSDYCYALVLCPKTVSGISCSEDLEHCKQKPRGEHVVVPGLRCMGAATMTLHRCTKLKAAGLWFCSTTPSSHERSYQCRLSTWHDGGGQTIGVVTAKKMWMPLRSVSKAYRIVFYSLGTPPHSSILLKDVLVLDLFPSNRHQLCFDHMVILTISV
jgi:hypothetical protein